MASSTPPKRRVTARDVAAHAHVSLMTVSRVLNDKPGVRPETRARVERAIGVLGFTPNGLARALADSKGAPQALFRQPKVAFVFDSPNATYLGEMVGNGFAEATASNLQLVFVKTCAEDNPALTARAVADLGVEGVILPPPICDDARLRLLLAEAGMRVVAIGCCDGDPTISTIGIDDSRAAFEVTRYLIQLGHRRIGFILGHPRHRSSARRRAGHEAALLAHGIAPDRALQWEGRYDFGSAIAAAEEALNLRPPITALFASNDDMAAAVMSVARGRGIDVPRSLSVCGFDDSEIALMMFPQLTTVGQPIAEMVRLGVQQLAAELYALRRKTPPVIRKLSLKHTLVFRNTDAPPADCAADSGNQARIELGK
jgi:LacI family transcriptional regulator